MARHRALLTRGTHCIFFFTWCGYQVLSPRLYRLFVNIILQRHPSSSGGTEIILVAGPRECGDAIQPHLGVSPHRPSEKRDIPATGLPSHTGVETAAVRMYLSGFVPPADISCRFYCGRLAENPPVCWVLHMGMALPVYTSLCFSNQKARPREFLRPLRLPRTQRVSSV